jgi:hypothetical protein
MLESGDTRPDRFDPSGILVTERQRNGHAERVWRIDDVEIRMTDACGADADEHFTRPWLRLRHRSELNLVGCDQSIRMHVAPQTMQEIASGLANAGSCFSDLARHVEHAVHQDVRT